MNERKSAELKIGFAKLWARAKQLVTTDPTGSDEDDHVVDEEAARVMAEQAGKLKGGLAKVAQLAAYDPGASLGRRGSTSDRSRQQLAELWDRATAVSSGAIASVVEADLGKSPQAIFAAWDPSPLASASLGQVHGAKLADGTDVVVKVQYPGVAAAMRADLADHDFLRKLSGSIGARLDTSALEALAEAVRGELDYRAEAAAQQKFARAWADDPTIKIPRVIEELSTEHVLVMTRAKGKSVVEIAASGDADVRRQAALGIFKFAWGSPLVHGLLNADPNPGNFLVERDPDGRAYVWCLDFGCALELPDAVKEADLEIFWGLLDSDGHNGAERFRMGLGKSGLLARPDLLASAALRDWERLLAQPLSTHGDFHWSSDYAVDLAEATGRSLALGGLALPAKILLAWRQRLGASSVIGLLDSRAAFRRVLAELIGTGKRALR